MKKRLLVYLASPYTPTAGEDIEERVTAATKMAADLMQNGFAVFAPVPHTHYIANHVADNLRFSFEFWMEQDLAVLEHCNLVVVLCLPGWKRSRGVAYEISRAKELGIPVVYIHRWK